jgi:chromosome segregation ATPase
MTAHEHDPTAPEPVFEETEPVIADADVEPAPEAGVEPGPEAGDEPAIGDQVMDLLQDVERQFDLLRDAHAQQSEEVTSLRDRSAQLDQRALELEQQHRDLAEVERALSAAQERFERERTDAESAVGEERRQLEKERGQTDQQRAANEQARSELEQQRLDLKTQFESLQTQHDALEETRAKWSDRRKELDDEYASRLSQLEQREVELGQDHDREMSAATERIAWLEQQIEAAGATQEQSQQEKQELADRIEQGERLVGQLSAQIEDLTRASEERARSITQHERVMAERQERIEQLEQELESQRSERAEAESQAMELAEEAEQERDKISRRLDEAREARDEAVDEIEQLRAQASQTASRVDDLTRETTDGQARIQQMEAAHQEAVEEHEARVRSLREQLVDSQEKLELAGQKLTKFSQLLKEQGAQLEQGAAAMALVDQQRGQIEGLTHQLAEARVSGDPDALKRKDQRIKELTEALHQSRGQTGSVINVDALEQQASGLSQENDRLRVELEQAQLAATEAQSQLDEHLSRAGSQEQANENTARELELERAEMEDRIQSMEGRVEQAEAEAEQTRLAGELAVQRLTEERSDLQTRVQTLEASLKDAEQEAGQQSQEGRASEAQLDAREVRIRELIEHLRRRHRRLQRVRTLLRHRQVAAPNAARASTASTAASPATAAPVGMPGEGNRLLQKERLELEEVRRMLGATEKRMMRRWAMPRAITVMGWLLVLVAFNAVASWLVVDHLHPARTSAVVSLQAVAEDGPLSEEEVLKWRTWHEQSLVDDRFLKSLARRMGDVHLEQYNTPEAISERLDADLSIDATVPERLTLSLAGYNDEESMAVLDVLATSLATKSKQEAAGRAGTAYSVVRGERDVRGRARYAAMNPVVISDNRLEEALPIFGGALAGSLILVLLVYSRLVRSKRLFDENDDMFVAAA